ncbi:MAG: hypothetical protein AAGN66_06585 [Acidobacteriota bacterium]
MDDGAQEDAPSGAPGGAPGGAPSGAPARLVLLGASNLARQLPTVVDTGRRLLQRRYPGRPVEVWGALGRGRSYGSGSWFLGRALPGIRSCGLWSSLAQAPAAAVTHALVTDVGNDLGYGRDAPTVARWVGDCIDRLRDAGAAPERGEIVLTSMPIASLSRYADWQLDVARRLLFPLSTQTAAEVRRRSHDLDDRLRHLADDQGLTWVEQQAAWYGVDPVHLRPRMGKQIWSQILGSWATEHSVITNGQGQNGHSVAVAGLSWSNSWRLRRLRPEHVQLFGREIGRPQPCGHLPDLTVWLF